MTKTGSRKYRELEYNYNKDIELIISHKKNSDLDRFTGECYQIFNKKLRGITSNSSQNFQNAEEKKRNNYSRKSELF